MQRETRAGHRVVSPAAIALVVLAASAARAGVGRLRASRPGRRAARQYSWEVAESRPTRTGDLEWTPRSFAFEAGESVRYIDFENGDDADAGTGRASAWKHHPWDSNATGRAAACSGVHTYVFKQGVVYRGSLTVRESGAAGNPIRLTSDPSFGGRRGVRRGGRRGEGGRGGEAVISGAVALTGGWTRGAGHPDIPEPGKVWRRDLDFAPRNLWMAGREGARGSEITRIPLARTPNWKVSNPDDVKSEWWHWDYPNMKHFDNFTKDGRGRKLHLGIDTKHITRPEEYYKGAVVWTEYGWVMGTPYPARVEVVDLARKGLGFGGQWGGVGGYKIIRHCRYYLDDKPHYLDDPDGEFWFDRKGAGGRLYVRLPGGRDPNGVRLEAGRISTLVDAVDMNHVHITGLTFRFTNTGWDLTQTPYAGGFRIRKETEPACIRLMGKGRGIRVSNCLFEHVNRPVHIRAEDRGQDVDSVLISDNEVRYSDHGGISVSEGALWGHILPEKGRLYDVKILRNRLYKIGLRPTRYGQGVAITVNGAETAEIAGNILDRCWGLGIDMHGGKKGTHVADVPLSRVIAHHNRVIDPLLNNNDFGGIETWQGGPFYVYSNIVGNPGGYQHWKWMIHGKEGNGCRFGHAYYLDGAFKNYHFNNIAWGKSSDRFSPLGNTAAVQEIHSYQNTFFNNTFYNFLKGSRRQAPQGGRNKFLGNVWHTMSDWVFWHTPPARTAADGNERDAGPQRSHYALETNAYSRNVFYGITGKYAAFKPSGRWHETFESAREVLAEVKAIEHGLGEVARASPLADAEKHDFRLSDGSAAVDKGVKVFVPWGLYATVGEWNFYPAGDDPTRIIDEHWYMTPYYFKRDDYHKQPMFPLKGVNVSKDDYVDGPLEDWTRGALRLNGENQYAVCPNDALARSLTYQIKHLWFEGGRRETRTASGEEFRSPQVWRSSFLIEAYFRTEPGNTGGVLAEKMSARGYSLVVDRRGGVTFGVRPGGAAVEVRSTVAVNDGGWHHVVAEADRGARRLTLYIDGRKDAEGAGVAGDDSLENDNDLYVGGTPDGRCLAGTFEFLRISLGTLKDAKTDIDELYTWQFHGPFLRDFLGNEPRGRRDAGAIEKLD